MEVVLTDWATQAYADLKSKRAFTDKEYWNTLRPDAERLKAFPSDPKFKVNQFWGPANLGAGQYVSDGYKMKWDGIGSGKVELRLMVAILGPTAFLCQAYVKTKDAQDYREALNLKRYINLIRQGRYVHRGNL